MAKKQSPIVSTADEVADEPEKWIWATDDPLRDAIFYFIADGERPDIFWLLDVAWTLDLVQTTWSSSPFF